MRILPDRIAWSLGRRIVLSVRLDAFDANIFSYASRDVIFAGNNSIKSGVEIYSSSIGRYTYCAERVRIRNCIMGCFCSIGAEVIIGELAKHPVHMISTHPLMYSASSVCGVVFAKKGAVDEFKKVVIGADVFIGTRAMVFPGVSLGVGCIVAAGAVVTKDVPPYAIVAGVPAKIIKYRFSSEIASRLIEIGWWDWEPDRLRRLYNEIGGCEITSIEYLNECLSRVN